MFLTYDASRIDGFKGQIKLAMPKYRDRLQMIKDCNFKTGSSGEMLLGLDNLDSIIKMIEITCKAAKEVTVTCEKTDVTAKSFDEMELNPDFDAILQDVAGFYMNAGKVGNS